MLPMSNHRFKVKVGNTFPITQDMLLALQRLDTAGDLDLDIDHPWRDPPELPKLEELGLTMQSAEQGVEITATGMYYVAGFKDAASMLQLDARRFLRDMHRIAEGPDDE